MRCRICQTPLINTYVCPNCGQKDELAKKIIYSSNWHYNQGLEKTKVRDLSGATASLLTSLKYNKRNTQARNLLGLVYFQMGEIVNALGEWVISVHFQPSDNRAAKYIKEIQTNPGKLQSYNRIIKKYNKALVRVRQGNMDMAIVELKKVTNMSPNYVRAYQLLALCYYSTKQYANARTVLLHSLHIDRSNVLSLRYIQEIDAIAGKKVRTGGETSDTQVQISDPTPVIVEEKRDFKYTEFSTGQLSFVNVVIGVVVGAAVVWFLVVPSLKRTQSQEYNQAVVEYSSQISENNKLISSYEKENEDLNAKIAALEEELSAMDGLLDTTSDAYTYLYQAILEYLSENSTEAGLYLAEIDTDSFENEDALEIYEMLYDLTAEDALEELEDQAEDYLDEEEYSDVIRTYEKVLNLDSENENAMYYIGYSYLQLGDLDSAMDYFEELLEYDLDSDMEELVQEAIEEIEELTQ